ncbi:MAG: MraY family glycosyltransferase [Phycisphaerae bacterium]
MSPADGILASAGAFGPTQLVLAAGLAAILAASLGFPVRRLGLRFRIMDQPGSRSSHSVPVPRVGGLSIILAALIAALVFFEPSDAFLVATGIGLFIAAISFFDDLISLNSSVRLLVHLAVAGTTIWRINLPVTEIQLPWLTVHLPWAGGIVFATLFVVAFINFFNFMDGINGIAAAQGIWGGLGLAILLLIGGAGNSVITAAVLAGACLGYLPHNFPKARMFMGDVGSTTLGFGLAMLVLVATTRAHLPLPAAMLPLGVFLYDATFTLIKRICRGENFLKAHREHHYQLLIRSGWSHTRTTGLQMALMTFCVGLAILYIHTNDLGQLLCLAAFFCLMPTYSILVHRLFARKNKPAREAVRQTGS